VKLKLTSKLSTRRRGITLRRNVVHIAPNEPCPCGSGRKYKKCCENASGIRGWWRRRKALQIKRTGREDSGE